jgi:hypothetical protein
MRSTQKVLQPAFVVPQTVFVPPPAVRQIPNAAKKVTVLKAVVQTIAARPPVANKTNYIGSKGIPLLSYSHKNL